MPNRRDYEHAELFADIRLVEYQTGYSLIASAYTILTSLLRGGPIMIDTKGMHPVAIACTGGSGSRVLRDILDASPQIFMDRDYKERTRDSQKSKKFLRLIDASAEHLCRLFEEFMSTILAQIPSGQESQYKYFGWKNPKNLLHADVLFRVHSDLRFLHLIRDPRAIARGSQQNKIYAKQKANGEIDPNIGRDEFILSRWAAENVAVWTKHKNNPRYLLVRYEEMIARPVRTVRWLFDWLGVDKFRMSQALAAISPPQDAIDRGNDVDVSLIEDAANRLGYVDGCFWHQEGAS